MEESGRGRSSMVELEMTGAECIAAERRRQVEECGWDARHDDSHRGGSLAVNAAELAVAHTDAQVERPNGDVDPWGLVARVPDTLRRLEIAGALIAAEIDRLQRQRIADARPADRG